MAAEDAALAVFGTLAVAATFAARAYLRRVRRAACAARPSRAQLLVGNALVFAAALCFAMLAGECWFRFGWDTTDQLGLLRTTDRWFERHYRMNDENFRDDVDYELGDVPAGLRRVTFVGDSFTTGHGVADVRERFANRVRAAHPEWEVHVFAHNGLDTRAELALLDEKTPAYTRGRYRYDLVVLVYCLNDIVDVMPGIDEIRLRRDAARERGFLARTSYLFDMLRFLRVTATDDEVRGFFPSVSKAYESPAWDDERDLLRRMEHAVVSRGGRFAVVTFPFLHDLGPAYPFREAHRRLGAFWREEGVPHLDLLPVFEGRDARDLVVGRFDAHPNERAHALAAEAIGPLVEGALRR